MLHKVGSKDTCKNILSEDEISNFRSWMMLHIDLKNLAIFSDYSA